MKTPYIIVRDPDDNDRILELLNEDEACRPYTSNYCGGCDACLLMQAEHQGCTLERLELEPGETLGDGLGRINALFDAQEPKLVSYEKGEHDTWSDVYGRMGSNE